VLGLSLSAFVFDGAGWLTLRLPCSYPWNFWLLMGFTVAMGMMVATTCAVYQQHGMGMNIAISAGITMVVFIGLTIFVQLSDIDFSFLGLFLPVCLLVLIVWMIVALLLGVTLGLFFGLVGVLLFAGFIIYDTYMIMNKMGCDDYIIASIELYLDVINFFSFFLLLMQGGDLG
jgi:FtsH-binding integral membrane protein